VNKFEMCIGLSLKYRVPPQTCTVVPAIATKSFPTLSSELRSSKYR